jgi:UDP-N-acetyl-2-amino-2-deoxyglucuronate dehydrogenase
MYSVGIIGCGTVHSVHAEALLANPRTGLVSVVDIVEERARESAEKYGSETYCTDYRELLKRPDIDAVHICTPHYLHAPMAIEAMKSGKNVLVEKPMAIKPGDAEEMIKVSEETGRQLGVCFQNRYNRTAKWVKEFLDSEKAGKVLGARAFVTSFRGREYYSSGEWRGTWDKEGGGVLINQSIHTLDMLQWFLGNIDSIKASWSTRLWGDVIEVEDTAEMTIRFKSRAIVLFYATNCYSYTPYPFLEIHCENAVVRIEEDVSVTYADGRTEIIHGDEKIMGDKAYWGHSHNTLIEDFYATLEKGGKFAVDGRQGITAVKMVNSAYQSQKSNEFVSL